VSRPDGPWDDEHHDDGSSLCIVDGCAEPALYERITGIIDVAVDEDGVCEVVEKVCAFHRLGE
jgi:hypothetical protein